MSKSKVDDVQVDDPLAELPRYRATWTVGAVKIEDAKPEPTGGSLLILEGFLPHTVPATVARSGDVDKGDYLVILADGTQMVTSATLFLRSYELVESTKPAQRADPD